MRGANSMMRAQGLKYSKINALTLPFNVISLKKISSGFISAISSFLCTGGVKAQKTDSTWSWIMTFVGQCFSNAQLHTQCVCIFLACNCLHCGSLHHCPWDPWGNISQYTLKGAYWKIWPLQIMLFNAISIARKYKAKFIPTVQCTLTL